MNVFTNVVLENATKPTEEVESETAPMQPSEDSTSFKRKKATRMVTKTCMDDEGYMSKMILLLLQSINEIT